MSPCAKRSASLHYRRPLLSHLDVAKGAAIRAKSLDNTSHGVHRHAELREAATANDGYIEPNLWTGIGRARSGCGAAIGNPDQIIAKLALPGARHRGVHPFELPPTSPSRTCSRGTCCRE